MRSGSPGSSAVAPTTRVNLPFVLTGTAVALLLLAIVGGLQFSRHFAAGSLDAAGMDWVQSARQLARTGKFSTEIVRPLLTARVSVNGDGTAPDFAHGPLYLGLVGVALRITHQIGPGRGDREAVLVNLLLYVLTTGATYLIARRLFAERPYGIRAAVIACVFFALGSMALSATTTVSPALLGALLFTLLLLALHGLDRASDDDDTALAASAAQPQASTSTPRSTYLRAALCGAIFGLFFLTLYSALLVLPALLVYVFGVVNSRRKSRTPGLAAASLFLAAALVVAAPLMVRNLRLAHNPLYNAHMTDLLCNTASYPGYGLWGESVPPRALSQYLAGGGVGEILAKAAQNVMGFCASGPVVLGLFVTPLFAIAALSRFPDSRVGRLRTLVYVALACHLLGLSFFQPFGENLPLLLVYAPFAAALAGGFMLSLIQARRLPTYYALATQIGWTALACIPGLVQIAAPPIDPQHKAPYGAYAFLNDSSNDMANLRESGAYLTTDAPEEAAFRLDLPVVSLPVDGSDMQTVTGRTGREFGAILLTPAFAKCDPTDFALGAWVQTYHEIIALSEVAARLSPQLSKTVVKYTHLLYPSRLAAGMEGFRPSPFVERGGAEWSLIFWNNAAMEKMHAQTDALSAGAATENTPGTMTSPKP